MSGRDLRGRLDAPEVRAALEANRAKLAMMAPGVGGAAAAASTGAPPPAERSIPAAAAGAGAPAVAAAAQQQQQPQQPQQPSGYRNPMYGEAALLSPDKKVGREYAPKLADAIRAPTSDTLVAEPSLPPVGDLFAAQPQLPAGLRLGGGGDGADAPADGSGLPRLPDWNVARPYLTGRFLLEVAQQQQLQPPGGEVLQTYPPAVQEALPSSAHYVLLLRWRAQVVDAMGGVRVAYQIVTRGQLEPAMQEMAARMLPLCEYVVTIQRYVETRRAFEWGLVCQALAAAMRGVLQDWELMVAQLEHQLRSGRLTLQALWYYVQPPLGALRFVACLAAQASAGRARGAALLDLLDRRAGESLGDAQAHKLALRLLRAAAEPYFAMLERWLAEGQLDDPYAEFMVQEDSSIGRDSLNADSQSAFWHDRYTLRPALDPATGVPLTRDGRPAGPPRADVPCFLARVEDAILTTGKYLNVMRECRRKPPRTLPVGVHLEYDEGGKYLLRIGEAAAAASAAAMALLRRELGMAAGLTVFKRCFLTAQGDMVSHFMDAAEVELGRPVGGVPLLQLQALLDGAVRSSSAAEDGAARALQAAYDHRSILTMLIAANSAAALPGAPGAPPGASPLKTPVAGTAARLRPTTPAPMTAAERAAVGKQRTARESFILAYAVPWPLSVVAPEAAVAQYQLAFRHLFDLKWVDRELSRVASVYAHTAGLANARARAARGARAGAAPASPLGAALARSYSLCQMMTHFFRQARPGRFLLYVTFEVLEPLWAAFETKVQTAASLDEIVEQHKVFLRQLMKGCLLSRKVSVLQALLKLKASALAFVRLTDERVAVSFETLEDELAEALVGAPPGAAGRRAAREAKATRLRGLLEGRLADRDFLRRALSAWARCTQSSWAAEELESLHNLMLRLDFNDFFSRRAAAKRTAAGAGLPLPGAAPGDRLTVRF
eukprot:scaffold5.g883.t1